jgi:HAD superfamily hydrolase (TIGR01450 family)
MPTLDDVTKIDLSVYDAVLLDLDGTIWSEDVPLPGAIDLIRTLQARRQPFAFISNNDYAPSKLMKRLDAMGLTVPSETLYTAACAACDYVRHHCGAGVRVFNLAGDAVPELLGDRAAFVEPDDGPCDVVLTASLGLPTASIPRIQAALRYLLRGACLVAMSADRRYPTPGGAEVGAGGLAAMLAYGANVQPIYCGKPQRVFFEELCTRLNVRPGRCVLIGDNLESDVAGARQVGMRTILPLTGITTREHLEHLSVELAPDEVIEDLRSLA